MSSHQGPEDVDFLFEDGEAVESEGGGEKMVQRGKRGMNVRKIQRESFADFVSSGRNSSNIFDCHAPGHNSAWEHLTIILNDKGPPKKSKDEWNKNFRDWIYQIKHKQRNWQSFDSGSQPGSSKNKFMLTNVEKKVLSAFGEISCTGDPEIVQIGIPSAVDNNTAKERTPPAADNSTNEQASSDVALVISDDDADPVVPERATNMKQRSSKKDTLHILAEALVDLKELRKKEMEERNQREDRLVNAVDKLGNAALIIAKAFEKKDE